MSDQVITYYNHGGDPVAFTISDGPGWVALLGSPAAANRYLEKHVSLYRAQAQMDAGGPLEVLLEEDIDIDDALDWVDRYLDALRALPADAVAAAETPVSLLVKSIHVAWEEPEAAFMEGQFVEQEGSWYLVVHSKGGWTLTQVPGAVGAFDLPADDACYGHGTRWSGMTVDERRTAPLTWADEDGIFTGPDALLDHLREEGQIGKRFEMQTQLFASMLPSFTDEAMLASIARPRWRALLQAAGQPSSRPTPSAGDI